MYSFRHMGDQERIGDCDTGGANYFLGATNWLMGLVEEQYMVEFGFWMGQ